MACIRLWWLLALCLVTVLNHVACFVVRNPSISNYKVAQQLRDWTAQAPHPSINDKSCPLVLLVDGNNVRGALNFQWSQARLLELLCGFGQEFDNVSVVMVLDHGTQRQAFAISRNVALAFAGLSQMADDVLVKESSRIINQYCQENWSCLGIVTNDVELLQRVRYAALRGSGSVLKKDEKRIGSPLFLDATNFAAFLNETQHQPEPRREEKFFFTTVQEELDKAMCLLGRHASLRNHQSYHPRREQTWHRVVLAETMRSSLLSQFQQEGVNGKENDTSFIPGNQSEATPCFVNAYVASLRIRGYGGGIPQRDTGSNKQVTKSISISSQATIRGPLRLDKRQRKQLTRFLKALEKGRLDEDWKPNNRPENSDMTWWQLNSTTSKRSRRRHRATIDHA